MDRTGRGDVIVVSAKALKCLVKGRAVLDQASIQRIVHQLDRRCRDVDFSGPAAEMGHTSLAVVFQHYRDLVEPEEAACYWNIRPTSAATNVVPTMAWTV